MDQQVFRGREHRWTPTWRGIAVRPLGLGCIGSGIHSCQPTLGKREVTPHGHLYPFLVPPAHQSSSPREPQKPPSDRPFPCAHSNPRPSASPISFQPSPPPLPPQLPPLILVRGGHQGPGLWVRGWPGFRRDICPEHHQQGLGLRRARKPGLREANAARAGPGGSQGAYLHTIILLVSPTLPSYGGEKVEGYQHQAGHQGPECKEEQHPRAAGGQGAGSAIRGDLLLLLLPPPEPGTASGPLGGPGLPQFSAVASVAPQPHGWRLRKVSSASQDCELLSEPGDSLWIPVTTRAGVANPEARLPARGRMLPPQPRPALILAPCCCGGHVSALPTHAGQLRAVFCQ